MNRKPLVLLGAATLAGSSIAIACAPSTEEGSADTSSLIKGGVEAKKHDYAALVDINRMDGKKARCSGAVIAPRVVLTAGHCIVGAKNFTVTTPFAGKQQARGVGLVYDYTSTSGKVARDQHDIGLVVLGSPIHLAKYPGIQRRPIERDAVVTKIGRVKDGYVSNTTLFESPPMRVEEADDYGFPYAYVSNAVLQPGDSGGPDIVGPSDNPTIVGVNSGGGSESEILARVDLLAKWIDEQVAIFGGGEDGGVDAGADGGLEAKNDAGVEAGSVDAAASPSKGADAGGAPEEEEEEEFDGGKPKKQDEPMRSSGCSTASAPSPVRPNAGLVALAIVVGGLAARRRVRR